MNCIKLDHRQRRKLWKKQKRQRKRQLKYLFGQNKITSRESSSESEDVEAHEKSQLPTGKLTNFAIICYLKALGLGNAQVKENNHGNLTNGDKAEITCTSTGVDTQSCGSDANQGVSAKENDSADKNIDSTNVCKPYNDVPEVESNGTREEAPQCDEVKDLLSLLDEEVEQWHNPILPLEECPQHHKLLTIPDTPKEDVIENFDTDTSKPLCMFFLKTGMCRYGDNCKKRHVDPKETDTLVFPNMFQTFAFDIGQRSRRHGDQHDLGLEYSDNDLHEEFVEFYNDIVPEFESCGRIRQVFVCCNRVRHLCGNVYVQFRHDGDALSCHTKMYGRFYNGKQLQCKYVSIASWNESICGMYLRNGICPRGGQCNFLHVFENPDHRTAGRNDTRWTEHRRNFSSRSYGHERHERKSSRKRKDSSPECSQSDSENRAKSKRKKHRKRRTGSRSPHRRHNHKDTKHKKDKKIKKKKSKHKFEDIE